MQEGGCSCLPARSSSHYVAAEVVAAGCSQGDATAHIPAWRNRAQHSPTMADITRGDGSVKAKALHWISYIKMQLWHFTLALSRTVWRRWVHLKWLSFHPTSSRIAINNPDFFINDATMFFSNLCNKKTFFSLFCICLLLYSIITKYPSETKDSCMHISHLVFILNKSMDERKLGPFGSFQQIYMKHSYIPILDARCR